VKEKSKTKR